MHNTHLNINNYPIMHMGFNGQQFYQSGMPCTSAAAHQVEAKASQPYSNPKAIAIHSQTDNNAQQLIFIQRPDNMVRRGRRTPLDNSIPSPCMGTCRLFNSQPICQGCFRHQDEIRNWPILSAEQKQAALDAIPARVKALRAEIVSAGDHH